MFVLFFALLRAKLAGKKNIVNLVCFRVGALSLTHTRTQTPTRWKLIENIYIPN